MSEGRQKENRGRVTVRAFLLGEESGTPCSKEAETEDETQDSWCRCEKDDPGPARRYSTANLIAAT